MSDEKKMAEARRWFVTARDDLEAAVILRKSNKHSLACFHSQQAAEKAMKAVHFSKGMDPWGHSVLKLFKELESGDSGTRKALIQAAGRLDQFYIPSRYPDGVPDITPIEAFSEIDSLSAIEMASAIVDFCQNEIGLVL